MIEKNKRMRTACLSAFAAFAALAFGAPALSWAHGTAHAHDAVPGWQSWTWAPLIVTNLLLLSAVYGIGWRRMKTRRSRQKSLPLWQGASYYLGIAVVGVALLSPIDAFSDVLGWVHMIQHTLLMMVAAPLMVFGSPGYVALWSVPESVWKRTGRFQSATRRILRILRAARPLAIWVSYALVLWVLHIPLLYEAALGNELLHDLQHLLFFFTSFIFWRVTLDPYFRRKLNPGVGIVYLFVTSLHAMILGVLMALSPVAWYSWYERTAPRFGITALQDQQLAGYIMWMPAGITFVVVAVILLMRLIREEATP